MRCFTGFCQFSQNIYMQLLFWVIMRTSFFIALFLCFCNKKQALSHREGRRLHNNKARKNTTIQFKDCSCQTYVFLCIRTQKKPTIMWKGTSTFYCLLAYTN